jgi:hypothetical protein
LDFYIRYQSYTLGKPKSIILSGNGARDEAFPKRQIPEKLKSRSFSMSENLTARLNATYKGLCFKIIVGISFMAY